MQNGLLKAIKKKKKTEQKTPRKNVIEPRFILICIIK